MAEHLRDMQEVTGSDPVASTMLGRPDGEALLLQGSSRDFEYLTKHQTLPIYANWKRDELQTLVNRGSSPWMGTKQYTGRLTGLGRQTLNLENASSNLVRYTNNGHLR